MKNKIYSRITTWAIRLLLVVIVLGGISLLMLSMLGGTTDTHRHGLEQAFSDTLRAKVTIGQLVEFNVMPQLKLEAEDIRGTMNESGKEFMVDSFRVAFSFMGLMRTNRKIEDFQLDNFRFSSQSGETLRVAHAGIEKGDKPSFQVKGDYNTGNYEFNMPLIKRDAPVPEYYFGEENTFTGKYGRLGFKGVFAPARNLQSNILKDTVILDETREIGTVQDVRQPDGSRILSLECRTDVKISPAARTDFRLLSDSPYIKISGCN